MDTFMDKLSQKLNAQEMIRANTSAELEELGQVKEQIQELKECVTRMEELAGRNAENPEKASAAGSGDSDVLYIIEEEVSQLGREFAEMKGTVGSIGSNLSEMKASVEGIGSEHGPESAPADGGELAQVQTAVFEMESSVVEVKNAVEGTATNLSELRNTVGGLDQSFSEVKQEVHSAVTGMDSSLSEVKSAAMNLQDDLSQVKHDVESWGSGLDRFQEDFSQYKQDFGRHKEEMAHLSEGIARFQEELGKLQEAQSGDEDVIQELRGELAVLAEKLTRVSENSTVKNAETMDALKRFLIDRLDNLKLDQSVVAEQKAAAAEQKAALEEMKGSVLEVKTGQEEEREELDNRLTGMHESLREGFHKECVKVYRNVQAAMIEEDEKQVNQLQHEMDKLQGKISGATIFSVLAFITAMVGVVMQILSLLNLI